jgi:hypothetical protein
MTGARRVEVHATLDLVGAALLDQHIDHLPHHRDLARGVGHHVGLAPRESAHVGKERAFLAPAEIAPAHAVARGTLQDRLVDVGHVLRVADGLAASLEMTHEDVEREERASVTKMRRVVRRHTADIDGDGAGQRTERNDRAAARVVQTEH